MKQQQYQYNTNQFPKSKNHFLIICRHVYPIAKFIEAADDGQPAVSAYQS